MEERVGKPVEGDVAGLEHEGRGRPAVSSAPMKLKEERGRVAAIFGGGDFNNHGGNFWKWDPE